MGFRKPEWGVIACLSCVFHRFCERIHPLYPCLSCPACLLPVSGRKSVHPRMPLQLSCGVRCFQECLVIRLAHRRNPGNSTFGTRPAYTGVPNTTRSESMNRKACVLALGKVKSYSSRSVFNALERPLAVAVTILRVVPVGLKYTARILLIIVICYMI